MVAKASKYKAVREPGLYLPPLKPKDCKKNPYTLSFHNTTHIWEQAGEQAGRDGGSPPFRWPHISFNRSQSPTQSFVTAYKLAEIGTSAKRSLLRSQLLVPSLVLAQGLEWLA